MSTSLTRRTALGLAAAALATPALPRRAGAQSIARTVRVIVGFPAGGSSDVVARLYADKLRGLYAPNLIVEGKVGAAGRIAVEAVKAGETDGSIYLQTPASMLTLQPHVFPREVRYDALVDLVPVSTVCTFPFAIAVPTGHPAKTLAELIAWMKAQGGEVPFASPAAGSAPHFLGVMLGNAIGVKVTHVPYRGAAPAMQDLVGGRLPIFVGVLGDISPQHGSGARMLAVSSPQRNPRYPDLPTFAELGYPQFTKDEWFGALLPANTPASIANALHAGIVQVSRMPEMVAALDRLEYLPTVSASPQAFAERIRRERAEWGPIVQESGFKPEN
ncbi:tripartite tricarboxylate transporter substrate-binding protein [Falsiroseomonas selenitidurans]|uniref:Twin-arginine translocation pathway signal protein n=1 Tax=Falsiroseomonas selenitidurans TaxID=2716335 RepID=A0ABX1E4X5_9PROT|nr:tripartite tricarboxylate transporter substrate-binding protein [Falsiroseomonas selenitidurans]NKC32141.1 twin-arginine translocation pathway signal protein [Falsiroseomonas selenitidurans]